MNRIIDDISTYIETSLVALRVNDFKKTELMKNKALILSTKIFGLIVCVYEYDSSLIIKDTIEKNFNGWRKLYVTELDNLIDIKYELIWELMKNGYMRYIRTTYPLQFKNLIIQENFGKRIIDQRLKVWDNLPQNSYLIEENKRALKESFTYILSVDPSFFDYMP